MRKRFKELTDKMINGQQLTQQEFEEWLSLKQQLLGRGKHE